MKNNLYPDQLRRNIRHSLVAIYLLVALMMASLSLTLTILASHFAPDWNNRFLVISCVLIPLLSFYTQRVFRRSLLPAIEKMFAQGAEILLILIVLRMILIIQDGISRFITNLIGTDGNIVSIIITPQYIFIASVSVLVWGISIFFAADFSHLESDEKLLNIEYDGGIIVSRGEVRSRIGNRVLVIGACIVIVTTLLVAEKQISRETLTLAVFNVFGYFTLGLILLSLVQLSIQRIHWLFDRFYVHRNIAQGWIFYTAIILVIITLISITLPTSYSMGILSTLQSVFGIILSLISFIISILFLPIILIVGFLLSLFSGEERDFTDVQIPEFDPTVQPPAVAGSWLEVLRSILFWGGIITVLIVSFTIYFREHRGIWNKIAQLSIIRSLYKLLSWLGDLVRATKPKVSAIFATMSEHVRSILNSERVGSRSVSIRRGPVSARERVIFYYLSLVQWARNMGTIRTASQTPGEFSKMFIERISADDRNVDVDGITVDHEPVSEMKSDINKLTDDFIEARYSLHPVSEDQSDHSRTIWERLKQKLTSK